MSLKRFLNNPDVRAKFREEFPAVRLPSKAQLLAPPRTTNYTLVGTAFDYLMRFYLKRVNRNAVESAWIAEQGLDMLTEEEDGATYRRATGNFARAQSNYKRYLRDGRIGDALARSALHLAQLDDLFRGSDISFELHELDRKDIADLRKLASYLRAPAFKADRHCILNPMFGDASALVGGADADFILDDMLVDVKTTKDLELKRDWYNQLVGYYLLYRLGGIEGLPNRSQIRKLAIYYSRHALLATMDVKQVVDERLTCPPSLGHL